MKTFLLSLAILLTSIPASYARPIQEVLQQGVLPQRSLPQRAATKTVETQWIQTVDIDISLDNLKKQTPINDRTAKLFFSGKFPNMCNGWRKLLPASALKNLRKPSTSPKLGRVPKDQTPAPKILRFTNQRLIVAILKPLGSYRWHHHYDCLALLEIKRTKTIDTYFNLPGLEARYGFSRFKGISQGSSTADVVKVLGKPDSTRHTQAFGHFVYTYQKLGVKIWFQNDCAYQIN